MIMMLNKSSKKQRQCRKKKKKKSEIKETKRSQPRSGADDIKALNREEKRKINIQINCVKLLKEVYLRFMLYNTERTQTKD